jgi:hypothetical protein
MNDKKYLDKVIEHLVRRTKVDYDEEMFLPPFSFFLSFRSLLFSFFPYPSFIIHCRDVYGLNEQEIKYVWKEYRNIIKDKIDNGE